MKDDFRRRSKSTSALPDVRLAVTGGPRVGKSAIAVRFLTKRFIGDYQKSVERIYRRNIVFGNDVIEYDLRDSADTIDYSTIVNWSTCIAVVYSIIDRDSFTSASTVLDEIDTILNLREPKLQMLYPCLALIGNKKDLEHFRAVSCEEGKALAKLYGAGFWETSASEDYNSTHKPLNSLIVESYLNVLTAKNTDSNSLAPDNLSGFESKPRTKSDTFTNSKRNTDLSGSTLESRCSIDTEIDDFEKRKNFFKRQEEEAIKANTNNQLLLKENKRRRNQQQELRKQLDLKLNDKTSSRRNLLVTTSRLSLDGSPVYEEDEDPDTLDLEVTDTFSSKNELLSLSDQSRSNSLSKKDKKSRTLRRINEAKSPNKMLKSKSYSDFKSFAMEQNGKNPAALTCIKKIEIDFDEFENYKSSNEYEILVDSSTLLTPGQTPTGSSFTKLSSIDSFSCSKTPMPVYKSKKERKISSNGVDENGNLFIPEKTEEKLSPNKLKRNEHKKSVRRKLSAIFRPKVVIENV